MFPSYRNQSVDLQSKSTDWFLYDGNIGRQRLNSETSPDDGSLEIEKQSPRGVL